MRNDFKYEELTALAKNTLDPTARLNAASIIMERCGDHKMSETMKLLSSQLDFDDSENARSAINRTRVKLDDMIEKRRGHNANFYIKRIRDDEILAMSGGEVTDGDYDELKSCFCKNGLFDPDIFGGSGKIPLYDDKAGKYRTESFGTKMGHITLPVPVVLKGDYCTVARLLCMTDEDVEKVAGYEAYLVLDPSTSGFKKFSVITEAEHISCVNEGKEFYCKTGGEAIRLALESLGYDDEPERLAFFVVPVSSPITRPCVYSEKDEVFYSFPLNDAYLEIIRRVDRIKKLMEIGAPEIILHNEEKLLDNAVNCLDERARAYRKNTHWETASSIHYFIFTQIQTVLRYRVFGIEGLMEKRAGKTDEIESLHLYPDTILVCSKNGEEAVPLTEVVEHNDAVLDDYQNGKFIFIDGEETEEEEAQMEEYTRNYEYMKHSTNDIIVAARVQREKCRVVLNEKFNIYVIKTV